MASSRWKRFAFFDKHTLNLPSPVLEDLQLDTTDRTSTIISMQITTASLPLNTKITQTDNTEESLQEQQQQQQQPLSAMWSSLTACSAPSASESTTTTILLPSQQQHSTFAQTFDGLVLVWIASVKSSYVHCLDISLTCRAMQDDFLNMDGWRGYFQNSNQKDGIVDIAVTRSTQHVLYVACLTETDVTIHANPHLHLSCRLPVTQPQISNTTTTTTLTLQSPWNEAQYGHATTLDMRAQGLLLAVGTNTGHVLVYDIKETAGIFLKLTIPPPPQAVNNPVTFLNISENANIFCTFSKGGICCFELAGNAISARHDLDSRLAPLHKSCVDHIVGTTNLLVARPDGLYTYSQTAKTNVSPIDGTKNAICAVPPPARTRNPQFQASYALVASTDVKSGRDAVDIYDATNKLVAFHVLLSPGHKALRAVGITTNGRSTAVVFTSGGSIVSLTEKPTSCKISLLVQKNLYAAAISMAYADPAFQPADITALYRRHAEHLYRKGDYSAAMDQYIYTIGSLESAHVIFRYLDAPKIPMLAKYLEELRNRDMATPVHNELLRTCYLKLNDQEAAEKIAASASRTTDTASCSSLVSSLAHSPKEALATICTFEAPQAAEALLVHGAVLARALPRETAGVVVSLCVGTYSPSALAEASGEDAAKMLEVENDVRPKRCTPYPFHLFASAFVESPKVLRLILAHCNRNKCPLTPSLRRSLLELTLSEWNDARRTGDTEAEKLRRKEAITALTDAHSRDIGDYDALVLVQLAGFAEGELLLYERLQMTPMLLARYAQDGGDRARRHMLAMCRTDPEILADVLGHFVAIASERIQQDHLVDDASLTSEEEDILDDIREALALARAQGALPPVRIARILAGEGSGQFSADSSRSEKESQQQTVPLSVALDYVGAILDDSRQDISRLKAEVEEYNQLCNSMEAEVNLLLSGQSPDEAANKSSPTSRMNIEELHSRLKSAIEEGNTSGENRSAQSREAFWREMNQSEDRYDTIARFFAKGIIL